MQRLSLILITIYFIGFSTAVMAQQEGGMKPPAGMAEQRAMMPGAPGMQGGPGTGMGMHGAMGMAASGIVASSDGGVIVLAGHTLYKYDKDLNLVKEVELPRPLMGKGAAKEGQNQPQK